MAGSGIYKDLYLIDHLKVTIKKKQYLPYREEDNP